MKIQGLPDNGAVDRELHHKFAVAIRAAQLGIWEWDLRTDEFSYSDRAKEIFGFHTDEVVTRQRIIEVLHPDDHRVAREQAASSLDPSLKQRTPYRYRIFRAGSRELRWIHAFGEPIFEVLEGKHVAVRFIGTLQDITDEVQAHERLADQEARLRLAIEASGIAIWEVNLADQTITHSPELNRLCGFPPDARPTLEEFRSRYAPGERERMEQLGAEARLRGETKLDTEIHHLWPDGTEKWLSLKAQIPPGESGYGGRVIGVLMDITEQKRQEEYQKLLLTELNHRIKNSFAVTQSVINQTLRGTDVPSETRAKLSARLQAMADAHEIMTGGAWESAALMTVLNRSLETFGECGSGRIIVQAEDIELSPRATLSFSLVLHELLTNAVKYGSLSNSTGTIHVKISHESLNLLRFTWIEKGGPRTAGTAHEGFGTRLIERVFGSEFEATIRRTLDPEGLSFIMEVPLSRLQP
ncbi:sensor histidine kinase [Aquibium oceanicum]|uniref:Blue-light-activated histidine kinase n=1 Tax=Aquibium oceanicum TaxID=1670800 RepID=A0A1L3SXW5_9HYPH|nr:sensor histidine kinase [Aquibium oceanicum]APH74184.1 hypothetical protein BSQ44_24540 [Aquibium oceanicum]